MLDQAQTPETPNAPQLPEAEAAAGQEPSPGEGLAIMPPEELAIRKERAALGCQKTRLMLADYYFNGPLEVRDKRVANYLNHQAAVDGESPEGARKHAYLNWNAKAEDFSGLDEWIEGARAGAAEGEPQGLCQWGYLIVFGGVPGEPRESGFGLMMAAAKAGLAKAAGHLALLHDLFKVPVVEPGALMRRLEEGAEQGDELCQLGLGHILEIGSIARKNWPRALELYQKAAEAGRGEAAYKAHKIRMAEDGDKIDLPSRIEELRKLVDAGIPGAMLDLGVLCRDGKLGEADYQEARRLFIDSAIFGARSGATAVGEMHQEGQGVPQSYTEARLWQLRGIELGSPQAMCVLSNLAKKGLGSEVDLQIERESRDAAPPAEAKWLTDDGPSAPPDYALAERLLKRAANEHNYPLAWLLLSDLYREGGPGVPKSLAGRSSCLKKAADLKDPLALKVLGRLHILGEGGVPQSKIKALSLLKSAAELGDAESMGETGLMYYYGNGIPKNGQKAIEWLEKGAAKGDLRSQNYLFSIYNIGDLVPKDDVLAFKYGKMAAEQGDPVAQRILGCLYGNGIGVKADRTQGFAWLRKAADQGDAESLRIHRELMANGQVDMDFKMPPPPWKAKSEKAKAPAKRSRQKAQLMAKGQKGRGLAKIKNAAKAKEAAERGRTRKEAREGRQSPPEGPADGQKPQVGATEGRAPEPK